MSEIIKSNDYDEKDFFKEQINDCVETVMSEDFEKYLAIANHDIQMANNTTELKSYVASILYDNDKKVELLQQKENIIKEVRENIKENWQGNYFVRYDDNVYKLCDETLEILDKAQNEENQ